jgi:SAM-dependent methyltransferase
MGRDDELDYGPVTARYYDAAYATLEGLGADVGFYRELARRAGGPVLELGCGTGRVLAAIAADGLARTGVDASPEMLAVLRERAGEDVELVCADMRGFDLGGRRFPLIFSAFRAFQHLITVEDQLRCLARVRAHLAPGGCFAFDVFNPRPERTARDEEPESEDLRFTQDGDEVVRLARVSRDRARQTLHVVFRYERRREGRRLGSETTAFDMRWFHRYELEHLLARAGFSQVEIFGDFDRSPVGPDSPAFAVVAR